MFKFEVSALFVEKVVLVLNAQGTVYPSGDDVIVRCRADWGKAIVGAIRSVALRLQRAGRQNLCIIEHGRFHIDIEDIIDFAIPIPKGDRADELLTDLASEFLVWARTHAGSTAFREEEPLLEIAVRGELVVARTRIASPVDAAETDVFAK